MKHVCILLVGLLLSFGDAGWGQEPEPATSVPPVPPPSRIDESRMDVIQSFRAPVEKYDNGIVKTMLRADRAAMQASGVVEAEGVVVELYDAKGVPEGVITAESATVDQRRGRATGRGPVRFDRNDVSIQGVGLVWLGAENILRIESEAVVELVRGGRTLAEGWK